MYLKNSSTGKIILQEPARTSPQESAPGSGLGSLGLDRFSSLLASPPTATEVEKASGRVVPARFEFRGREEAATSVNSPFRFGSRCRCRVRQPYSSLAIAWPLHFNICATILLETFAVLLDMSQAGMD